MVSTSGFLMSHFSVPFCDTEWSRWMQRFCADASETVHEKFAAIENGMLLLEWVNCNIQYRNENAYKILWLASGQRLVRYNTCMTCVLEGSDKNKKPWTFVQREWMHVYQAGTAREGGLWCMGRGGLSVLRLQTSMPHLAACLGRLCWDLFKKIKSTNRLDISHLFSPRSKNDKWWHYVVGSALFSSVFLAVLSST